VAEAVDEKPDTDLHATPQGSSFDAWPRPGRAFLGRESLRADSSSPRRETS
jgi:hypothetical protein